jgi:predicted P-loop ATPase
MTDLVGHSHFDLLKLLQPKGPWALAAIVPDKDIVSTRGFMPGRVAEEGVKQWLKAFNGQRNIYFQPSVLGTDGGSKAKKEHVSALPALWVDLDPTVTAEITFEQSRTRILETLRNPPEGVPVPSIIVDSGNGFQAYWLLTTAFYIEGKPANIERFEAYNRQLAKVFGADHCWAVNHLMRLPGTLNISSAKKFADKGYPEGKREAKIVHFDTKATFSLENFRTPTDAPSGTEIDAETYAAAQLTPGAELRRFDSDAELLADLEAHNVGAHVYWSIIVKDLDELFLRHKDVKLGSGADAKRFKSNSERHQSIITALATCEPKPYTPDQVFAIISDPRWEGANQHYRTLDVGMQRRSIVRSYAKGSAMVKAARASDPGDKALEHVQAALAAPAPPPSAPDVPATPQQLAEKAVVAAATKAIDRERKKKEKQDAKFSQMRQQGVVFPDGYQDRPGPKGMMPPANTLNNIVAGLEYLGVSARKNTFQNRTEVSIEHLERRANISDMVGGEASDTVLLALRALFVSEYSLQPTSDGMKEAVEFLAAQNAYCPITDYLDDLPPWDGVERLPLWLHEHFGVEDDELHRQFAKLTLMAAVKRVLEPGCKFDNVLVLEGMEGLNKSSALKIMAGEEFFSDQEILRLDDVKLIEQLEGHWINECAELKGVKKVDNDHIKTILSRQVDRGRRAWGRYTDKVPRKGIIIGTSNDDAYLTGESGELRRWWPARIRKMCDIEALAECRDALWAEALHYVRRGDSLILPERLWSVAKEAQKSRMSDSTPWDEDIEAYANSQLPDASGYQYVTISRFMSEVLRMDPDRHTLQHKMSIARHLKKLGFTKYSNGAARSYRRYMPVVDAGPQHEMEAYLANSPASGV